MKRFKCLLVALLLAATTPVGALDLRLKVVVPAPTPADSTLYLAGNINGWNPKDPAWKFPPVKNGVAEGVFSIPEGYDLEYKFTRGSWETVEKGPDGEEIDNHTWTASKSETVAHTVGSWRDQEEAAELATRPRTVTGTVLVVTGPETPWGDARKLRIRLPEGYASSTRRYPVLYMHDGQNLFDQATSYTGEWEVDETLTKLEAEGRLEPTIVVGIDNSSERLNEYSPYVDGVSRRPGGKAYVDWMVNQLKPWIDAQYRTLTDAAHTAVAGSSMGGLISLYAALEHPEAFGQAASFSGAFWIGGNAFLRDLRNRLATWKARAYVDVGTAEGGDAATSSAFADGSRQVAALLGAHLVVEEAGRHHESAWAKRFGPALLWLRSTAP